MYTAHLKFFFNAHHQYHSQWYCAPEKWFLALGTFGNVWRCAWSSQIAQKCYWHLACRAIKDAGKHLNQHRAVLGSDKL